MIPNFWPIILKDIFLTNQFFFWVCSIRNKIYFSECMQFCLERSLIFILYIASYDEDHLAMDQNEI